MFTSFIIYRKVMSIFVRFIRLLSAMRRVLVYFTIYGLGRTLFKVAGRLGTSGVSIVRFWRFFFESGNKCIGLIGCGQYGFSTIGYFSSSHSGKRFASAFDTDENRLVQFCAAYGCDALVSASAVIADPRVNVIYVASNHATHASYAIEALEAGKTIYIEKPIATDISQLKSLYTAWISSSGKLYCGYNRPLSPIIGDFTSSYLSGNFSAAFSLFCNIVGHALPADHWYRNPGEGSRICGNLGHWIDLSVHLFARRSRRFHLYGTLTYADPEYRDENLVVSLTSSTGDVVSIAFSARGEPFEGVQEQIVCQVGDVSLFIDDFRSFRLDAGRWSKRVKLNRKDPGHRRSVLQPFSGDYSRDIAEVFASGLLILQISDAVNSGETSFSTTLDLDNIF
jgi:predicted dehydrogenase